MKKVSEEIKSKFNLTDTEESSLQLKQIDETYEELESIIENKERYSMDWAYNYAHDKIEQIYKDNLCSKFCKSYITGEPETIKKEIVDLMKSTERTINKSTKTFYHAQTIIDWGEIIVSFIVIMAIHEITAICVDNYSKIINASIIVIIFALFKIFIEKKFIHKFLIKREQNIYKRALRKTKQSFIHLFILKIQVDRFNKENASLPRENKLSNAVNFIKLNHHVIAN